jgi:hypothetical protein
MLYRESISNRDLLLSIFTKEELEDNCVNKKVVTQEEFNKFFEENILSRVDASKTISPDKVNFSRIQLCNYKGEWLLDYDYNPRNTHFKYHYNRVYIILRDKFSLQDDELQVLMKSLIESHFYLKGVASQRIGSFL